MLRYIKNNMIYEFSSAASSEPTNITSNDGMDTLETIPEAVPVEFTEVPIEDQLAWHTLWPESHKLYGHGNELYSLCCSHEGKLVASSCKVQGNSFAVFLMLKIIGLYISTLRNELSVHLKFLNPRTWLIIMVENKLYHHLAWFNVFLDRLLVSVNCNFVSFSGSICSSCRNLAVGSWFMEICWPVAFPQLNSN